jgi:hypothetical protein
VDNHKNIDVSYQRMSISVKQQALTRGKFDDFHQMDDMRITSYALRYYINPPAANCPTSFPVNATTRIQKSGASWASGQWKTDVESDLMGINRFGSRVKTDTLYNPVTNPMNNTPYEAAPDETFPLVFNRLNNPPCTLRGTGWNRWQALPHQPQLTFETPFDHFIPSKLLDKERCKTH